jgi:peptidoglycan/LPS O-acetylase OafA/YrhL
MGTWLLKDEPDGFAAAIIVGIGITLLIIALSGSSPSHLAFRMLEWRPLIWIGLFSYSLYLIHGPIIQMIWQYVVHPMGLSQNAAFIVEMVIGIVASIAAAFIFHLLFERPFLNNRSLKALTAISLKPLLPRSVFRDRSA